MSLNFNKTINSTLDSIDTKNLQIKLGIPNKVEGPGSEALTMLQFLNDFILNAPTNASFIDTTVNKTLTYFPSVNDGKFFIYLLKFEN
jgi:hypothetical protein